MITVLDVENSTTQKEKRLDVTPYNVNNKLVSVGWCPIVDGIIGHVEYVFFHHNELDDSHNTPANFKKLQDVLDRTTLLVGHNMKHDLAWLLESGFKYDGLVYDTKIAEFILNRGRKWATDLGSVAVRRNCSHKKSDLTEGYLKKGIGFEAMPLPIVQEYGEGDVQTTGEIYLAQQKIYGQDRNSGLIKTRDLMNEFCVVLTNMERNGIAIDQEALDAVKIEYQQEKAELIRSLHEMIFEVMGDTPINLNSPEQLSQVIYSRKLIDKDKWEKTFNIGLDERGRKKRRPRMKKAEFAAAVRAYTEVVHRTKAHQCQSCGGTGKYFKTKKNGDPYARAFNCPACNGTGLTYENLPKIAGFKMVPEGPLDVAVGGFATDKTTVAKLAIQAQTAGNEHAIKFMKAMSRLNAVNTYLDSFVGGIERGLQADGILHPRFNQTVTSTGRLSSSDPNFQNQPRGATFPVRRTIVSRFPGGKIIEADYSQLEFRCAGILSGDPNIKSDVRAGVDAHAYTASVMTKHGQPTDRQAAKPHTFKPLYGGTSGTPAEQAYYKAFLTERYPRTGEWHKELMNEAVATKLVVLPTGREYAFAAERTYWGGCTFATQIKNYPVQGFATADIVPLANILFYRLLTQNNLCSLLINTVHDSIVVDVYPGEEQRVCQLLMEAMLGVVEELRKRYNIVLSIPLAVEVKIGSNWLDGKVIATGDTDGVREYTEEYERIAA